MNWTDPAPATGPAWRGARRSAARPALPLAVLAGLLLASPSLAAGNPANVTDARHGQSIVLALNKSRVLGLAQPFARALVGNAEIADVLPMSGNSIYILGKKAGTTNLTLYDRSQNLVAVIDITVGPDAEALGAQIVALMPAEHVGLRVANDALILTGTVTNAVVAQRLVALAETYAAGKVVNLMALGSPQQVMLEVRFSEMQRNTVEELGIRSISLTNSGSFGSNTGDATPADSFATLAGRFGIGGVNINVALDALEQKGLVRTLAQPNLIALSGETASFLAGGEIPIPVASSPATGGVQTITVEFKEFGVRLGFTPTVLEDGIINLVVQPEVSSIDPTASIRLSNLVIPGLRTRRAKTTLELRDGQSFAIAGLLQSTFSDTARQVPLLGNIPLLGALFRSTSYQRGETELVIVVTPRLVGSIAAEKIRLPTDLSPVPSQSHELLGFKGNHRALPAWPAEPRP